MLAFGALVIPPAPSSGRLVEVFGDPATADGVAIIVPGADVTVKTFDTGHHRPGGSARALLAEASRLDPDRRLAVVAWLGYDSPPTVSLDVMLDTSATRGAAALRRAVADLRGRTAAPITLLCHSYGSVVCVKAVPGLPVTDLVVFGSPGLEDPSSAAALTPPRTPAASTLTSTATAPSGTVHRTSPPPRLWAGRGDGDWIRFVPKVKLGPLGFGADPMDPAYGARLFEVGAGGHSDYFRPGTASLRNLALIALGRHDDVTRAPAAGT